MRKLFANYCYLILGLFVLLMACFVTGMDGVEAAVAVDYQSPLINYGVGMVFFVFGWGYIVSWFVQEVRGFIVWLRKKTSSKDCVPIIIHVPRDQIDALRRLAAQGGGEVPECVAPPVLLAALDLALSREEVFGDA